MDMQTQVISVGPLSPRILRDANDEMPACQSCRKRKLKCSRQVPSCSQCTRLSCVCVYDQKKHKPGLRSGMVEHLNRRLEAVEKALVEERRRAQHATRPHRDDAQGCAYHAALLIANSILKDGPRDCAGVPRQPSSVRSDISSDSRMVLGKRKRPSDAVPPLETLSPGAGADALLPGQDVLDATVDCYFAQIHFWIPMIHEGRFRARLADAEEQPRLVILLHAMVAVSLRHVETSGMMTPAAVDDQVRRSRNIVLLNGMECLSVENLQALSLLAFDHSGSGNFPSAWSIVGSLTKSVDYLQLAIEPDEQHSQSLLSPPKLLPEATSPIETEERRRVFWNVVLLDRFCSVTSGWNSSLNSYNVRRRLPSNGGMWATGQHVVTPFLGILDKSTAKVGNLMSYVSEPSTSPNEQDSPQPSSPNVGKSIDTSNVGAFAFRIEATESLNQVICFFLQQEIDFKNREEVSRWLARFKELDLRLVQWKLFFPQRWNNSKVSKERPRHVMDPNLTLAHLTHNASTILLHQHIATPPADVQKHVSLPSSCSAETCQLAAIEIASITERYLSCGDHPVPSQFAFCAFIAARTLLVRWRFATAASATLHPGFVRLVAHLEEMSRRWQGATTREEPRARSDIAARYARELLHLRTKCNEDPGFRIELLNYPYTTAAPATTPIPTQQPSTASTPTASRLQDNDLDEDDGDESGSEDEDEGRPEHGDAAVPADSANESQHVPDAMAYYIPHTPSANVVSALMPSFMASAAQTPLPGPRSLPQTGMTSLVQPPAIPLHLSDGGDELAAMSQVFWDQQFLDLDRVFTLDGTDFGFG